MVITWYGGQCIGITSKRAGGAEVCIIVDPYEPTKQWKLPRSLKAHFILSSAGENPASLVARVSSQGLEGEPLVITGAGEYERGSVFVTGRSVANPSNGRTKNERRILYRCDMEEGSLGILHALTEPLTEEEIEFLDGVHILVVPVARPLSVAAVVESIQGVEPSVVLPVGYRCAKDPEAPQLAALTKALGVAPQEPLEKWKVTRADLEGIEGTIVVELVAQ